MSFIVAPLHQRIVRTAIHLALSSLRTPGIVRHPWRRRGIYRYAIVGSKSHSAQQYEDDATSNLLDGPFSKYCTDSAEIWNLYMKQAKISNDNLANTFNSNLDPLLLFATLFSAILTAFLIEIRKSLPEALQDTTNTLLLVLIHGQNISYNDQTPPFQPTSSALWVNGLWFSSLMFSLMSALGASVAKGWVTESSSVGPGSSWRDACEHARRLGGVRRWHMQLIIECLPFLMHIAFFLFSCGLVVLLFHNDRTIGIFILALTALVAFLYIWSSF
ncbi:hypothetical protein B0H11DRAFT_1752989, partial [Mycena galericulata]